MATGASRREVADGEVVDGGVPRRARRSSLQQERSQRTRASIVDAAARLWAEQGFDAVKVSDICRAAGASKGSFYFYFSSKEDLLVELLLRGADQVAEVAETAIEADVPTEQVLRQVVAVLVRHAGRQPRHLLARGIAEWFAAVERHASIALGHQPLHSTLAKVFEHGQARGEISSEHHAEELGGLLEWTLLRAELEWSTSSDTSQATLLRRLWDWTEIILKGSGPS